jgi:putative redox protein
MASEKARQVVVEGRMDVFRQEVHVGPFDLVGDQPAALGGGDGGPGPYDYLLIALGTCTSMTIGLVARRQGWPLEGVRVTLRHDRIHADDCADCETKRGMIDHIVRDVELSGPLTPEQRASLFAMAQRCPVATTLTSEIRIEDHLAPSGS